MHRTERWNVYLLNRLSRMGWQSLGATCTVIIEGDSIKVVHNGKKGVTGKKGDIYAEGIIMRHTKTGKWIIGKSIADKAFPLRLTLSSLIWS